MLIAPFRKPLTSFWSGDRLTVSLDGKSKSGSAIFPLSGSWVLAKNGESCRPPPSLLEPRMGILLPCLTHPRLTVLKPLRQVDAITPRRGCRAVARSISVIISTAQPRPPSREPARLQRVHRDFGSSLACRRMSGSETSPSPASRSAPDWAAQRLDSRLAWTCGSSRCSLPSC